MQACPTGRLDDRYLPCRERTPPGEHGRAWLGRVGGETMPVGIDNELNVIDGLTKSAMSSSCRVYPMDDRASVAGVNGVEKAGESLWLMAEVRVRW